MDVVSRDALGDSRRWLRAAAPPIILFAIVFLTHTHGSMGCADSRWSIHTAVSLVDHGDFDLDEFESVVRARGSDYIEEVRGHRYTRSPFGISLLAVPAIVVLRPVART